MYQTINTILILLTISLVILLMVQYRKIKRIRRDCNLGQLKLIQYRYQCDPHSLLNQINSLASFPTRIQPSLMQSKILEFGKQLRQALIFTSDVTSLVNKQVDVVRQFIDFENQNSNRFTTFELAEFNNLIGFEALPSHLLPNLLHGILRSRNIDADQRIKMEIRHDGHQLMVSIEADHSGSNHHPKGLAGDLLKAQLHFFNGQSGKRLEVLNQHSPDDVNEKIIKILFY